MVRVKLLHLLYRFVCPVLILTLFSVSLSCAPGGRSDGYFVSGRVVDGSGTGVEGVAITCSAGEETATDAEGFWFIGGLEGTVTVTPLIGDCSFEPASREVVAASDGVDFVVYGYGSCPYPPRVENGSEQNDPAGSNRGVPLADVETYEEIASFIEQVTSYWPIDYVLPLFDDPGELDNDELILAMTLCEYTPAQGDETSSVVIRAEDLQKAAEEVFGPKIGDIVHRSVFPFDWDAATGVYRILGFGPGSYTEAKVLGILETEAEYIVDAVNLLFYYTICYDHEGCTPEFYVQDEFGRFVADLSGSEGDPEAAGDYLHLFPVRRYTLTRMEEGAYYISRAYMAEGQQEQGPPAEVGTGREDCFLNYLFMDIGRIREIFGEPYEDGVRYDNYYLRFGSEDEIDYHFAFDAATGKKAVIMSSAVEGENILGAALGMTFAEIESVIGPGVLREGFRGYGFELHYEFQEVVTGTGNIEVNFRSLDETGPAYSVEVRSLDLW